MRDSFGRPAAPALLLAAFAAVLGAAPVPARAATATTTMAVSATVPASCTVAVQPMAFGTYNSAQTDANSTISVTCTTGTGFSVGLDAGGGLGATVAQRHMTGPGGATLNYSLYNNVARTALWGNTLGTDVLSSIGTGSAQAITVYGRVPANQMPAPGLYTDSVTVTLTY